MIELGKKLNGRYQITGNIGSGGMANVFLAHDLILDRNVAVKVLRFDFQNDQTAIRRFQREALAATELVHPNIVSVYDVGEEDNMQYLVMEYVKGMDLKRYIQTHYPVPYETAVNIMQQILSAISLAHNHQIIHRDLKPQNALIDNEGVVKITDFGIAIALSETSITQTNTMLGSVHYLSPEQARGSMATKQSDIYALGIILYEMLTGSVPFDGESAVTIALKHFQDDLPSIKALDPNVPQALENVILRATAKEPADRYKSAEEMSDDLSTVLSPARANEEKWQPHAMDNETKVITPLAADTPMPDSFKSMPLPKDEPRNETLPEEEEVLPDPKKKGQKKWWLILLAVLAVLGIGTAVFFASGGRGEVVVPDVSDLSEASARETLAKAKLEVATKTEEIADDKIEEGNVVKTDPAAGTTVKQKREVTLYISSGTKKIKLDDYSGKSYEDAEASLKELGFSADLIQKEEEFSSEVESGMIISQSPSEDTEVDPKTDTITFTVSKGPETVTLSSHVGENYETVRNWLVTQGFNINNISATYDYSDTVPSGSIISQDPASGEVVAEETYISFVVSQGTEPKLNDISGYTKSEAQSYLASIGAEYIGHETSEYSSTVDKDKVIRTVPGAGTTITKGMVVNVIYSKGLDPSSSSSEKDSSDSSSSSSSSSSTSSSSKEESSSTTISSDSTSESSK
ncbi:Stk1 family PASTA domain-containing Ser/Thr kinase [Enterococcus faecium]|uniref:Stk1 family PASTA domain-containing Ser/Thr kinase n=1 Tax=Enterococcus TaxID=1350 RepID=UPI000CF2DA99|nr:MULTISPECIES: Stk1 family PASTA domain-containing Ser/Thr kinase [Enterococcus]PQF02636.1 Stk1 family PASTA domain-containing Ser/Thr kinase [Enterococcus faecium]PQF23688.1 Stk1 family PASTA domain-containing Ser/Thr kinase [Enterococcus faecium]PQG65774.1 Stk1 family PASTA domain-containing Ser/Thr kinase [Enterococcus faecium]